MNRSSLRLALLAPVVTLLVLAGPARAQQGTVDFTPFAGVYLPTANLVEAGQDFQGQTLTVALKQKTAVIFGGRVTGWITDAVGIEGGFGWALSDVKWEATSGGTSASVSTNANVWLADLSLLYAFPMQGDVTSVFVKVGPTLIGHTGNDTWSGVKGRTDVGGTVGLGLRFKVAPMVLIRIDGQDYMSAAKFSDSAGTTSTNSKFQNDFVFTAGLSIAAGGSR